MWRSEKDVLSPDVRRFETKEGARIYQIPLLAFPGLWSYVYLVFVENPSDGDFRVLIDTGSGFGDSNLQLEAGFEKVSQQLGYAMSLSDLTHVLITHGHIDHFGGLPYILPQTSALVGVHELDLLNLTRYEERSTLVAHRLRDFLVEAGVSAEQCEKLLEMYLFTKSLYHSVEVDFTYEAIGMRLGPFEMLHVPGHCAGHVVIRLDNVLFTGDHVLDEISPHQAPESLASSTGLDHYLKSLDVMEAWAGEIDIALGGHRQPIEQLSVRLDEIRELHRSRLKSVLEMLVEPHTVAEVSRALFGKVHGYNVLLALEEAGAHVEYLYQRGLLGIENFNGNDPKGCLSNEAGSPVAWRYQRLQSKDKKSGSNDA